MKQMKKYQCWTKESFFKNSLRLKGLFKCVRENINFDINVKEKIKLECLKTNEIFELELKAIRKANKHKVYVFKSASSEGC